MNNNFRTIHASTCYCKATPSVEVFSERYNEDKAYQERIDSLVKKAKIENK